MNCCGVIICLGCLISSMFALDELVIEGDRLEVPCACPSVRAIQQRSECNNTYHVMQWTAPNENGCVGDTRTCVSLIGGVCVNNASSTTACWTPCMRVTTSLELIIDPVKVEYEGEYTCRCGGEEDKEVKTNFAVGVQPKPITFLPSTGMVNEDEDTVVTCVIDRVKPEPEKMYITKDGDSSKYSKAFVQTVNIDRTHHIEMTVDMKFMRVDNGLKMRCHVDWNNEIEEYRSQDLTLNVQFTSTDLTMEVDNPHATEGDTVTLTCTADEANPTSEITWYRTNIKVTDNVVDGEEGGLYNSNKRTSVLTLTATRDNNGVSYICEVEGTNLKRNHVMDIEFSSTSLKMEVDNPQATEGDTVTLTCTAGEANPTSEITWYRNNIKVTDNVVDGEDGGLYNSNKRISVLTLTARRDNNGVSYRCEVEGTNLKKNHVMDVEYKLTTLNLNENPPGHQNVDVEKILTCATDNSKPKVVISWEPADIQDIETTYEADDYGGHAANSVATFMLTKLLNGVTVKCGATYDSHGVHDYKEGAILLDVRFTSTHLTLKVDSQHATEGDTVTLTCTADEANPTSHITWYRGSEHVADGIETSTKPGEYKSDISISTLTWTAGRDDNGVIYSCEVDGSNQLQEEHKMNIYFSSSGIAYTDKDMLPEGTTEVFECSSSSSSNPASTITWIMSTGVDLTEQAAQDTTQGDNNGHNVISRLAITTTKDLNGQNLTCNLIYETRVEQSYMYSIEVSYPHEVTIEDNDVTQVEESTIDLSCSSSGGNPSTSQFTWSFHPRYDVTSDTPCEDEHSAICSISSLSYTHTGRYTCTASNNWGGPEPSDHVDVEVTYSPKAAMDDVDPEKSFTSGSNETLNCTFYSNPAVASVMWHDGPDDQGELILTDGLEPNAEDVYISILYLVNVMHNRTVTCVATRVNHKKMEARKIREITAEDTFTFYIHITNEVIIEDSPSGVAAGMIAGVVVGILVAVAAGAALVLIVKKKRMFNSDAATPVLRPDATQRLENDFSPETPEDKVGIYENKAYGTEALYANMERSERPEPIMEPERIPVDDLHELLPNIEGLIYTELAIPRFITPKKNVIVDPPTDYATIVDIRAMFPERFPAKPDVPTKPAPPARRPPRTAPKAPTDKDGE